jgi:hypothetical protein
MTLREALVLMVLASSWLSACFLGYDSRWGEGARSQKRYAERAAPAELSGGESNTNTAANKLPVRAYVTANYAAQVTDEKGRIAQLIEDANAVLGSTLALRLELEEVRPWPSTPANLGDALTNLEATDDGATIGWVVGFVGRGPTLETNFSVLGKARMHGKHFVLRAMADAEEFDALTRDLDELDASERDRLYRRRLRHKATAVFLHELGHTLSVPHVVKKGALMHAQYQHTSTGFSTDATALMRLSLLMRTDPKAMTPKELDAALAERVRGSAASFVGEERDAWLQALDVQAAGLQAPGRSPPRSSGARLSTSMERSVPPTMSRWSERRTATPTEPGAMPSRCSMRTPTATRSRISAAAWPCGSAGRWTGYPPSAKRSVASTLRATSRLLKFGRPIAGRALHR